MAVSGLLDWTVAQGSRGQVEAASLWRPRHWNWHCHFHLFQWSGQSQNLPGFKGKEDADSALDEEWQSSGSHLYSGKGQQANKLNSVTQLLAISAFVLPYSISTRVWLSRQAPSMTGAPRICVREWWFPKRKSSCSHHEKGCIDASELKTMSTSDIYCLC